VKYLILFILFGCSSRMPKVELPESKKQFNYFDVNGRFLLSREVKSVQGKLISRVQLTLPEAAQPKVLEKSISVARIGTVKMHKGRAITLRPEATEFEVWLEGKSYRNKMQLDKPSKSMQLTLNSPESKWNGTQKIRFPSSRQFCFFSQIPECLKINNYLHRARHGDKKGLSFTIVWDNFPYLQEQYNGVGRQLFSQAELKFEGESKGVFRYNVEVEGQTILYQFSKVYDLVRIFWIAQGISILPEGEQLNEAETQ
jgi:hypothetical protein